MNAFQLLVVDYLKEDHFFKDMLSDYQICSIERHDFSWRVSISLGSGDVYTTDIDIEELFGWMWSKQQCTVQAK